MNDLPFSKPGSWYRGNLHCHSTNSDGGLDPVEVCQKYRKAGYDFLCLSDHFLERYGFPVTDTRGFRTPNFGTLLGAELHTGLTSSGELWHILAVGLPRDFAPYLPGEDGPAVVRRALGTGAFVAAAHPGWYKISDADLRSLGPIDAIEAFNTTSHDQNDSAENWHIIDSLLGQGHWYRALAVDDAHFQPTRNDFAGGWIVARAASLAEADLLAALKAGWFYSSTGAQIHGVTLEDHRLRVECSSAERVFLTGRGPLARSVIGPGVTEAEFDLKGFSSSWARITVRGADGKRAWTNPFRLPTTPDLLTTTP